MEARSLDGYIDLGGELRFLIHAREGTSVHGDGYVLTNLKAVIKSCTDLGLHVSRRVAEQQFHEFLTEWDTDDEENDAGGEDTSDAATLKLDLEEGRKVSRAALTVEAAAVAEASGMLVYVAREQRFASDKLLHDVGFLMAPGVFESLPAIAQSDFSEAGRCIAYEVATAAAFHLMRGTEDVLRWFHKSVIKRGGKATMWGPIVNELRARRNPPPKTLLDNLDNLRSNFRNPTQHPEKIYDIQEAQDLLSLSLDVVNRMVRHVKPELVPSD